MAGINTTPKKNRLNHQPKRRRRRNEKRHPFSSSWVNLSQVKIVTALTKLCGGVIREFANLQWTKI